MQNRLMAVLCLLTLLVASWSGATYAQSDQAALNAELIVAARKSDAAAVKALLAKGADANAKTEYGATPLFFACDRGSVEVARLLVEAGADINASDTFYKSNPLTWAVSRNRAAVVKLLLDKGAKGKELAMRGAIAQGHLETVQAVLAVGGFTPEALSNYLAMAENNKQTAVAEELKKAGAKPKPKVEFKVEPEALKLYEGVYKNDSIEFVFKIKEGQLIGGPAGQEIAVTPTAQHTFMPNGRPDATIVFLIEDNKAVSVKLQQAGSEIVLKRR